MEKVDITLNLSNILDSVPYFTKKKKKKIQLEETLQSTDAPQKDIGLF